jgi:hemerythrin-like domain-containing protein
MYGGGAADFDLMHDIMVYMTVYPDAVHHPKEDRLYAELKAARPELAHGMSSITAEHHSIAEKGLNLRASLRRAIANKPVRQNAIIENALRYADTLRGHMKWEERDLFRRLDQMIRDGHDVVDEAIFVERDDPLFGPHVEQAYARLLDSLIGSEQRH